MSDEPDPTKREGPARKAWMAPTVGADSVAPAPRETLPPSLSISVFDPPEQRFVETSELGRGGMGRVVEAIDRALGRSVAIKQSLATSSVDLARFEREVRITAQLQHPSVIPILDVGRDPEGHPFYIMRKIEGEPLADRVALAKTTRDRLALISSFLGAVDAAAYAHAKRIIHRDIKPWNILLGRFGETLLIDWGIARELDDDQEDPTTLAAADTGVGLTRLGVAQGTPGFLAPEQARGEVVDARADVYSLGATLFYILANQLPYGRISATEAVDASAAGKPPAFSVIPEEVPRELIAILTKAMAPEPAERYADAGELATDLRRFLAGQLVAAHAYSTREKLAKWVRRHRIAVTVGTIALVTVGVVSTISIRQVIHDRDAADESRAVAVEQADEAVLQRVRSLLDSDPTSAIAVLRGLRPDSPHWKQARDLVRVAVRGGIERRVAVHASFVSALAFSPDGAWLASGSRELKVQAVPAGPVRTLANGNITSIVWWGPRTLAFIDMRDQTWVAKLANVDSGVYAELETVDPQELVVFGEQLLVLEKSGALVAFSRERVKTVMIADGVTRVTVRGTRAVAFGAAGLTVIEPGGMRSTPALNIGLLRISPDGTRVAALGGGLVREWRLAELEAKPREWPRSKTSLGDLEYVGDQLIAWSSDGSGFVSLDEGQSPLWTVGERSSGVLTHHILAFDDGAVFVNDSGAFAIHQAAGTAVQPHREMGVTRADVDHSGRFLAFGLSDGSVLLDDLGPAFPRMFPVVRTAELAGMVDNKIVMTGFASPLLRDEAAVERGALQVVGLTVFDPETHQLHSTPSRVSRYRVVTQDGVIVGSENPQHWVWNAQGELVFELESRQLTVEGSTVYWIDQQGQIWKRTAKPLGPASLVLKLPATIRPSGGYGDGEVVGHLRVIDGELTITLISKQGMRSALVTPTGLVDVPVPSSRHVLVSRLGGVWWTSERNPDDRALWRGNERLQLGHNVDHYRDVGGRFWAIGDNKLSELDATGKLLHQFSFSGKSIAEANGTAYVDHLSGILVLVPESNLRSSLRVSGRVNNVVASGRAVVAMTTARDGSRRLAYWTDPVPADPAVLRTFLDTLTNARLDSASYVLHWD